jgi:hypothetical protein
MQLDTQLHRRLGCRFSFHKTQINPVATTAEASDLGHEPLRNQYASLFTLN